MTLRFRDCHRGALNGFLGGALLGLAMTVPAVFSVESPQRLNALFASGVWTIALGSIFAMIGAGIQFAWRNTRARLNRQ